jgi:hypothetical protein
MTGIKRKFNHGNEILFASIMILLFAPPQYKLPGLGILCFSLITAAVIDWKKNTKRVRRISKRVASCTCETISHMYVPLMAIDCTVCGADYM